MQKYNWNRKRIEKRKTWKKRTFCPGWCRLVTPTGTKGCASHVGAGSTFCPGWCYQPGQKVLFCPGCQTRDKRAPPFVPDWRSRLGNRDNSGFPTGTNQRFCSSVNHPRFPGWTGSHARVRRDHNRPASTDNAGRLACRHPRCRDRRAIAHGHGRLCDGKTGHRASARFYVKHLAGGRIIIAAVERYSLRSKL